MLISLKLFSSIDLYNYLFSDTRKSVIALSATIGDRKPVPSNLPAFAKPAQPALLFPEFRQRVGMIQASEFNCPSPFKYEKQAALYLPKLSEEAKDPNSPAWKMWAYEEIIKLIQKSQGRAFILCTSTKACKDISEFLYRSATGFNIQSQTGNKTKSQLIEWFKTTDKAVLVATSSFWEGVSIEGDALKLVIIDKIPFSMHTDPKNKARERALIAKGKDRFDIFKQLQIFPAIIKLMQGFGRLIRTKTDTGVVAILDPRLQTKGYRKRIINALPNAKLIHDLESPIIEQLLK